MKLLHIGLDAGKKPPTSLMKTFPCHVSEYRDINTGAPGLNAAIIQIAEQWQPDFVFMQLQCENIVSPQALIALKKSGAFVVNFTGDVRKPLPNWYINTGKLIDLTLFTNMNDVITARQRGIKADFCVMGYDPSIYRPNYNVKKDIDIAFFANNYGSQFPLSGKRGTIAQFLKKRYGQKFMLFGNGWKFADANYNHSQTEEAAMLNRCKIALNISHFEYTRYSSDRLNRTLGCGVFCLTHAFPEMEYLGLIDGQTCGVFGDISMLQNKIDYFLKHEDERKKIAAAGYKSAIERLTFDVMIKQALSFYPIPNEKQIEKAAKEIAKETTIQ